MPFALRSSSLRVLSQAVRLFALRSVAFAPAALCLCRSLPAAPHPGGILRVSATCRPASHLFDSASASLRLNNLAERRSGVPTPCPGIYRRGCGSRPIRSGWRGGVVADGGTYCSKKANAIASKPTLLFDCIRFACQFCLQCITLRKIIAADRCNHGLPTSFFSLCNLVLKTLRVN